MTINDPDNHSSVIPHLELNILECEVKWAYRKHYFWAKLVEVTEFQRTYLKSRKIMLLKCCTQYVSKFGKLSSGHRTGKSSNFIPIPKKGNATECPNSAQLCSFHMLARLCSKSFKLGFSSMWTKNFQMYSWTLKRQRNQTSNCHHSLVMDKAEESQKNIYFCFIC